MDMGAIRTAMGVLKAGETLGIFPEGRGARPGTCCRFGRRHAAGAQERMRRGAGLHRGPLQAVSAHGWCTSAEPIEMADLRAGRMNKETCDALTRRMEADFAQLERRKIASACRRKRRHKRG